VSDELELTPHPLLNPGAWSNWTHVVLGKEEVTIDFAILEVGDPARGTLLARLVLSPDAAFELRDELVEAMAAYTDRGQHPLED
jgi:hypothetical protein